MIIMLRGIVPFQIKAFSDQAIPDLGRHASLQDLLVHQTSQGQGRFKVEVGKKLLNKLRCCPKFCLCLTLLSLHLVLTRAILREISWVRCPACYVLLLVLVLLAMCCASKRSELLQPGSQPCCSSSYSVLQIFLLIHVSTLRIFLQRGFSFVFVIKPHLLQPSCLKQKD